MSISVWNSHLKFVPYICPLLYSLCHHIGTDHSTALELWDWGVEDPVLCTQLSPALPDGLVDCLDPDCCLQSACQNSVLCRGARDPLDIIQQGQTDSPAVKSFYDRIKLLAGKDSTHIIPGENPFNSR